MPVEKRNKKLFQQEAISKRNNVLFPDRGRISMKRNFLICPSHHRVFVCACKRSHWWEFSSFSEYS